MAEKYSYEEISRGKVETPESKQCSMGDTPLRIPAIKPNSKESFIDGPFGGKVTINSRTATSGIWLLT